MPALPVVAILAGGESRRMGRDKSQLELGGTLVLERIARAAAAAGLRCVVVGRPRDHEIDAIDEWLEDDTPGEGPLAALLTAISRLESEVILVACDMPLIDAAAFDWLARYPLDADSHGLVPRNDGTLEPLFGRYRPSASSSIASVLEAGRRSIGALIEIGHITIVDAPTWLHERLANVNTPDEFERVRRGLGEA